MGDAFNFAAAHHSATNASKNSENSNHDSMLNVRLTHEDSMDDGLAAATVENDDDSIIYPSERQKDDEEEEEKQEADIRRASKLKKVSVRAKAKRRRREKMRWSVCSLPNNNYLKLNWMQRLKIFDVLRSIEEEGVTQRHIWKEHVAYF